MSVSEVVTLETVVASGTSLVSADVGDELVLLHVEKNAYYDTDAIGADIWHQLEQPVRVGDLCDRLVEKYEVDPETCQRDVLAFLSEALREEVVRVVDDADPA
ncbi:MAG: PqqD family peptide modification chaperone [Acidobacteria bacterium]|nr:PqqD family peptide modification chaperone [Acidobacteriota bacterium]